MSCFDVFDGPPFNSIILGCEEEADEGGGSAGDWVIVYGWVRGDPDIELYVLESERGGDVICAYLAVLSWM